VAGERVVERAQHREAIGERGADGVAGLGVVDPPAMCLVSVAVDVDFHAPRAVDEQLVDEPLLNAACICVVLHAPVDPIRVVVRDSPHFVEPGPGRHRRRNGLLLRRLLAR